MHAIEHTYRSLLADVARQSGFSEIRGSEYGLQWCLNEAPKLEKIILSAIEQGETLDLDQFPVSLHRIATGSLVDPCLLRLLRQLLLFCYKACVTYDNEKTAKAYQGFLDTNHAVGQFSGNLSRVSPMLLDGVRKHVQSVLYHFHERGITPSHGPGAVTTSKERWLNRYSTIECLYPFSDWFSLFYNRDSLAQWDSQDEQDIIEAKVIDVPKDSRGPRLICVHPAEAIWIQQGLRVELERVISSHRFHRGHWPKGHVHFDDQTVNGRIALLSSKSRRYATIDLKEASDRLSDVLVQILFGRKYKFFGCCRAQDFLIPRLGNMLNLRGRINSYAPMGNATTFPVQSLVFWAICVTSLRRQRFHQPGAAFVFGDDIAVPTEAVEGVIDDLESFGLLVNRTKSFWRGAFRESCGVDAFNGVNVTPVRWKTTTDVQTPAELQSLSDTAMRLRLAGYDEAASTCYAILRHRLQSLYGKQLFTTNNRHHGGIAEYVTNDLLVWRDAAWHRDYQWFQSPVWQLIPRRQLTPTHGWNHVLESVCSLERTGRSAIPPRTPSSGFRPKLGWIPIL